MDFASLPWANGSVLVLAFGVICTVATMVYKGLLVPKPTHDAIVAVLEQRISEKHVEATDYKAAWLAEQAARRQQDGQLGELMELARTTDQFIHALERRGDGKARDALAP